MVSFRATLAALLIAGVTPPGAAAGADADPIIDRWIAAQARATNWQADFVQQRHLPALTLPLSATGRVWYATPGNFRWEVRSPAPTMALRNEAGMLVYYPRLRRAERYPAGAASAGPMKDAMALFDAGFPRDRREFDRRFRVVSLVATNSDWRLDLTPASASTRRMVPGLSLRLATNNFMLLGDEIRFIDGSRMVNTYSGAAINQSMDPAIFTPQLPANTAFTEPLRR